MQADPSGNRVEGILAGKHDQMMNNLWKLIVADIEDTLQQVVHGVSFVLRVQAVV